MANMKVTGLQLVTYVQNVRKVSIKTRSHLAHVQSAQLAKRHLVWHPQKHLTAVRLHERSNKFLLSSLMNKNGIISYFHQMFLQLYAVYNLANSSTFKILILLVIHLLSKFKKRRMQTSCLNKK